MAGQVRAAGAGKGAHAGSGDSAVGVRRGLGCGGTGQRNGGAGDGMVAAAQACSGGIYAGSAAQIMWCRLGSLRGIVSGVWDGSRAVLAARRG